MTKKRERIVLDSDIRSPPNKMNRNIGRGGDRSPMQNQNSNPNFGQQQFNRGGDRSPLQNPNTGLNSGQQQFTLNDVMSALNDVVGKLNNIEGEITRIWQKFEELDDLKYEVAELRKTKENFQRFEIEQKRKCILIKGLASKSKGKYETRSDTKASLDELFNFVDFHPRVEDYQRLGEIKQDETEKTLIRLRFATIDDKNELFQKFKDMGKNDELSKISLINDYPSFQLSEVKRLSQVAYDIRTQNKETKTRIIPRGLGVALQKKVDGKWMNVSTQRNEN